jgi:hypothetical protein
MIMRGTRGFARPLAVRQRLCQLIGSRVDGTGTAALLSGSKELTLTDNGTGDYTLTFVQAFVQVPHVVVTPVTAGIIAQIFAVSTTAVQIKTFAVDGTTATDADFHIMILGSDADAEV